MMLAVISNKTIDSPSAYEPAHGESVSEWKLNIYVSKDAGLNVNADSSILFKLTKRTNSLPALKTLPGTVFKLNVPCLYTLIVTTSISSQKFYLWVNTCFVLLFFLPKMLHESSGSYNAKILLLNYQTFLNSANMSDKLTLIWVNGSMSLAVVHSVFQNINYGTSKVSFIISLHDVTGRLLLQGHDISIHRHLFTAKSGCHRLANCNFHQSLQFPRQLALNVKESAPHNHNGQVVNLTHCQS